MTFTTPKNGNYAATVVALDRFVNLPNCDNVKAAIVFGNSIIVGKDTEAGNVGLYFPVECALSKEFLSNNNLYRKPASGNIDPEKKGYFEDHGRIKAVKFRGHKSEGFWIPLNSLTYLGISLDEFSVGSEFDVVGEHEICQKYVPKRNRAQGSGGSKQGKQARVEDRLVDGQFRFHIDTAQLAKNAWRLDPLQLISISDKWHGTSAIFSHLLVKRNLAWYEKLAQKLGVNVKDTEYGFTWASRRVVKGVDGVEKNNAVHFYSSDIWSIVGKEVQSLLPKGMTVYGEIVGFTPTGESIQKDYHYGCQVGTHKFLVYRITHTNEDGQVIEYSWQQMKEFCNKMGLQMVKELYFGFAGNFGSEALQYMAKNTDLRDWQTEFVQELRAKWVNDQMCTYNNLEVPAEGVVVKIERGNDEVDSYKLKPFLFLKRESDELDKGVVDMETVESEEVEELIGTV